MQQKTKKLIIKLIAAVLIAIASYFGLPSKVVVPVVDGIVEVGMDIALPEAVTPASLPARVTGG
jgi:hypothetical protein